MGDGVAAGWQWHTSMDHLRRAVFLDRDGVINAMCLDPDHGLVDSPANPDQFRLLPGVAQALNTLKKMGFLTVVVSNQPGIAKGKLTPALLDAITSKMMSELEDGGARPDAIYYCLHHPDAVLDEYRAVCECRKPEPGLLLKAARDLQINLQQSYMIGDGVTDIQAGARAGCKTIWIGNWKCDVCEIARQLDSMPNWKASNLLAAVELIRSQEQACGNLY